jgi:hypothetical protein
MVICSVIKVLLAGDWFFLSEKYFWLVTDKPDEQADSTTTSSNIDVVRPYPATSS